LWSIWRGFANEHSHHKPCQDRAVASARAAKETDHTWQATPSSFFFKTA